MEKLSPPSGGARSYSDFMRSLAAKYNNNEYFTPTTAGSSPPQVAPIKPDIFPFLGFPQGFPGFALPGLTGFNPFLPPNQDKSPALPPNTVAQKRSREDPLDLTEKRVKLEKDGERGDNMSCGSISPGSISPGSTSRAKPSSPRPHPDHDPTILTWSVEQVAEFVKEIEICREYEQVFLDNKLDGGCLPLLTENHLTSGLGMKLGPALKLLTALRRKLGPDAGPGCNHCAHCHAHRQSEEGDQGAGQSGEN